MRGVAIAELFREHDRPGAAAVTAAGAAVASLAAGAAAWAAGCGAGVSGTMEPGARVLFQSVEAFKQMPEFLQVWPAHGAGSACGKALGAVPNTTVGYERTVSWWAPFVLAGDEQGFVGDGGDQDARQDMFPSQVASYNDDDLIGTSATTADDNFDATHPLYQTLADLSALRDAHPALQAGAQIERHAAGSVYAFSRIDGTEYLVVLNNAETEASASSVIRSAQRVAAARSSCARAIWT